jgi:hypothetical protein
MPSLDGVGGLLEVADGRLRNDQCNIRSELGVVGVDDHDVVATSIHDGLSHGGLGQQRIHRHYTACEHQLA